MQSFVKLITELGKTSSVNSKKELLVEYFSLANDRDKLWTVALFTGKKPKKIISSSLLKAWCTELCEIPEWLFNESYQTVGDLAETIALLLTRKRLETIIKEENLSEIIENLLALSQNNDEEKKSYILNKWLSLDQDACFVFNKLMTGGFRIGISQNIIYNAIAITEKMPSDLVTYLFSGNWHPSITQYTDIINKEKASQDLSKPYPFNLAYPLETLPEEVVNPTEWFAEWKWDGIRGQCINRKGQTFIWSRGEELMTDQFPELNEWIQLLPNGTVLDGEILCADPMQTNIHPLPFSLLQKRISRKQITKNILKEAPVIFVAYDLLEWEKEDIRNLPLDERKALLHSLVNNMNSPNIRISELAEFNNLNELAELRTTSRNRLTEGLMLKRKSSVYQSGRKKGDWWKWKVDPLTIDCVLVYAQKGHGRRSDLYTDYTFAVKDGDRLISFTKAYSGLTDAEFKEVDAFIKKNALEKFGPVRTVKAELVFEIAFEGIAESKRHKAGIALRFPRMKRIRKDKKAEEINTLEDLRGMLRQFGQSPNQ
jgi:DNA ligase-1